MKASRFTSRFKRSVDVPAGAKVEPIPAAPAAAEPDAAAKVVASDPKAPDAVKTEAVAPEVKTPAGAPAPKAGPEQPAAATPNRASRLVEAVRPKAFAARFASVSLAQRLEAARPAALPVAAAAAIMLSLGLGYGLGLTKAGDGGSAAAARWMDATAAEIRQANGELARFAAEQKALKASVDAIRGEREKGRAELLSRQAQLSDKVEKSGQEQSARIARLADLVERLEKSQRDPSRLQALTERLDRIEKGTAPSTPTVATGPAPTPPPKPVAAAATAKEAPPAPEVTQTGSIAEAKPAKPEIDPRKVPVEGYFVRDIDNGFALVETRAGRYIDVAVGYTVPGVGRVEAIERRGRQWVVVTNKGYIAER